MLVGWEQRLMLLFYVLVGMGTLAGDLSVELTSDTVLTSRNESHLVSEFLNHTFSPGAWRPLQVLSWIKLTYAVTYRMMERILSHDPRFL